MAIKMFTDCIIVGFDDITQKRQKERAIQQLLAEKAVVQGKFEIASNILHDIGNAVVGFGSYVSRIKRPLTSITRRTCKNLPISLRRSKLLWWVPHRGSQSRRPGKNAEWHYRITKE